MMHNTTTALCTTTSIVRRYLLGESFKSILIRLTIILSAIGLVWSGIMLALVIHTKCQRSKQMLKASMTHHHLCDSTSSLNTKQSNRSKRNRLYDTSPASTSICCYGIRRFLSDLLEYCIFCSSSPSSSSVDNEISKTDISPITRRKSQNESTCLPMNSHSTSSKAQLVIETMTGRPPNRNKNVFKIGKKISLYHETESLSGDELKSFYTHDYGKKPSIESYTNTSNIFQQRKSNHYDQRLSISFHDDDNKNDDQTAKMLPTTQKYNTKVTLSYDPNTQNVTNTNINSCTLIKNTHQEEQQQQRKSLLMISPMRALQSKPYDLRRHSLLDDPITTDGSATSSMKHIPLVMITDTSSSNTNIVELETYEDCGHLISDIERRLLRELRATYRPRHST